MYDDLTGCKQMTDDKLNCLWWIAILETWQYANKWTRAQ